MGRENSVVVSDDQRRVARQLVAAGANVVAGSHPHVVQPFDQLAGGNFYSLGNFLFEPPDGGAFGKGAIGWADVDLPTARSEGRLEEILINPPPAGR